MFERLIASGAYEGFINKNIVAIEKTIYKNESIL